MKTETLKTIIQAFSCVSDDETRYHLTHVCIRHVEGIKHEAIATNGVIMCRLPIEDSWCINDDVFFSSEHVKTLKNVLKENKNSATINPAGMAAIETCKTYKNGLYVEAWPDKDCIENVYSQRARNGLKIRLNVKQLLALSKALAETERSADLITLEIDTKGKNFCFHATNGLNEGLIMGVRL